MTESATCIWPPDLSGVHSEDAVGLVLGEDGLGFAYTWLAGCMLVAWAAKVIIVAVIALRQLFFI